MTGDRREPADIGNVFKFQTEAEYWRRVAEELAEWRRENVRHE